MRCRDHNPCRARKCRYFVSISSLGNCVLRIEKPLKFREMALAMGVSKQRVDQIIKRAMQHFRINYNKTFD